MLITDKNDLAYGVRLIPATVTGNRRSDVRPEIFLCSECIDTARRSGNVIKLTGQSMPHSCCATCTILEEVRMPVPSAIAVHLREERAIPARRILAPRLPV
jgi:hypothetical protein